MILGAAWKGANVMESELTTASTAATTPAPRPADQTLKATLLQEFFLERFHRCLMMRASQRLTPAGRRLVDHALYSTYWDGIALGLRAEMMAALDAAAAHEQSTGAAGGDATAAA
jgi:hypothetical protein